MSELTNFDDIVDLDEESLRPLLQRINRFDLALALSGLPGPLQKRMVKALTDGSGEMVARTLDRLGNAPEPMISDARRAIVDRATEMGRQGLIAFDAVEDFMD